MLLSFIAPTCKAADNGDADFFARYECQRENVTVGDSVVVQLVVYSRHPFHQARCLTQKPKIKGGKARELKLQGERQQQKVRLSDGVYYAILWSRYMAGSDDVCTIRFPEISFEAELVVYDQDSAPSYNPFDPFGFFSQPERKSRVVRSKCKSEEFTLPVQQRPKRSTQDVIKSGAKVL